MSVIYVLIPIAILLTALAIYLFFWAVKTDQFDDLEKQGFSILFDQDNDEMPPVKNRKKVSQLENTQVDKGKTSKNQSTNTKIVNTEVTAALSSLNEGDQHDH